MGEGILRNKVEQAGLSLEIDSAGTGNWHAEEHPDNRATQTAKERGIDISKQRARQIRVEDFDQFDLILVADAQVYRDVKSQARTKEQEKKVEFIMNLAYPDSNMAVPDPYFGGKDGFDKVFDMLDKACIGILSRMKDCE